MHIFYLHSATTILNHSAVVFDSNELGLVFTNNIFSERSRKLGIRVSRIGEPGIMHGLEFFWRFTSAFRAQGMRLCLYNNLVIPSIINSQHRLKSKISYTIAPTGTTSNYLLFQAFCAINCI